MEPPSSSKPLLYSEVVIRAKTRAGKTRRLESHPEGPKFYLSEKLFLFQKLGRFAGLCIKREDVRTLLLEEIQQNYNLEPGSKMKNICKISKENNVTDL